MPELRIAALLAAILISAPACGAPFAYASNEGSGSVSVIDTATDNVTATLNVGGKPRGIAIAPDGKRLYISEQAGNALLTIDTGSGTVVARTPLGDSPEAIYLSADGKLLSAAIEENVLVLTIDTATGNVVQR